MCPDRQVSGAVVRGLVNARIGPFAQGGLDEALSYWLLCKLNDGYISKECYNLNTSQCRSTQDGYQLSTGSDCLQKQSRLTKMSTKPVTIYSVILRLIGSLLL